MRSKEDALDYRFFPEPDLPPLVLEDDIMKWLDSQELEIPHDIIKQMKEEYGFNKEYINALIGDKLVLDYFLALIEEKFDPKTIAKWISGPISAYTKENFVSITELKMNTDAFKDFLKIAQEGKVMDNQLKIVMEEMLQTGDTAEAIIKDK